MFFLDPQELNNINTTVHNNPRGKPYFEINRMFYLNYKIDFNISMTKIYFFI